jgi:predicted secreted protein
MNVVRVTEDDASGNLTAVVGDEIVATLKENPTTGYVWIISSITGCVETLRDDFSFESAPSVIGGPGLHAFTFRVIREGEGRVELECARPWAVGAASNPRFVVTVDASNQRTV